jgi:hypothetical protein
MENDPFTKEQLVFRYRLLFRLALFAVKAISWVNLAAWLGGHWAQRAYWRHMRIKFVLREMAGFETAARRTMLQNGVPVRDIDWVIQQRRKRQ